MSNALSRWEEKTEIVSAHEILLNLKEVNLTAAA